MYEALDLKAHTEPKSIDQETWHRVIVSEGSSNPVWFSDRLYKREAEALESAEAINQAIFALQCDVCGSPANYVDHFGNLDTHPDDIVAEPCSPECRRQMGDEDAALSRAGL